MSYRRLSPTLFCHLFSNNFPNKAGTSFCWTTANWAGLKQLILCSTLTRPESTVSQRCHISLMFWYVNTFSLMHVQVHMILYTYTAKNKNSLASLKEKTQGIKTFCTKRLYMQGRELVFYAEPARLYHSKAVRPVNRPHMQRRRACLRRNLNPGQQYFIVTVTGTNSWATRLLHKLHK